MQELAVRKAMTVPVIKLRFASTNIPEDAFPTDEKVLLPTYARLSVKDETLTVDFILRDPADQEEYGYSPPLPDFGETDRSILGLKLEREKLVRFVVEESWTAYPKGRLLVRDPGEVYEELYLLFEPWSRNNPAYHIDAFAKLLNDFLKLPVDYPEKPPPPDFPF